MRETIQFSGVGAGLEPPTLTKVGELIAVSSVSGADPKSGALPADPGAQFSLAFANFARLLAAGGVDKASIGLVNVWIADRDARAHIDAAWLECFPQSPRPARRTNEAPLPDGCEVLLQAFGRDGASVAEVTVAGLQHRSPIPAAATLGSWCFSSVVGGERPADKGLSEHAPDQLAQTFANAESLVKAAGGSMDGMNHMWVYLADPQHNRAMLDTYLSHFTDETSRPARKTVPSTLPQGLHVQMQFTADVSGAKRRNFDVPGVGHHDPIPLGSSVGSLLQSSGIHGMDPATATMITDDRARELRVALQNVRALVETTGGGLDSIASLTVLIRDYTQVAAVRAEIEALFAPAKPPALHFANYRLPPDLSVQFHVVGVMP